MTRGCSRLAVYFGERGRIEGLPVVEALFGRLGDHGVGNAVLLRAEEGFGPRHGLQSSSRLSLSEDLPLVMIAIGETDRIEAAGIEARHLFDEGLVTVESSSWADGEADADRAEAPGYGRITVWLPRGSRTQGRPAHEALVSRFRQAGADAATTLLGIDGLVTGRRQRAGFFSANARVPMLLSAVGPSKDLRRAWSVSSGLVPGACAELGDAEAVSARSAGLPGGQPRASMTKIAVYAGGLASGGGVDHQQLLVRRLRRAGARGATAFHGVFGFAGEQVPHGESLLTLRRRVPVLTELVDTHERSRRWLDEIETRAGRGAIVVAQPVMEIS